MWGSRSLPYTHSYSNQQDAWKTYTQIFSDHSPITATTSTKLQLPHSFSEWLLPQNLLTQLFLSLSLFFLSLFTMLGTTSIQFPHTEDTTVYHKWNHFYTNCSLQKTSIKCSVNNIIEIIIVTIQTPRWTKPRSFCWSELFSWC